MSKDKSVRPAVESLHSEQQELVERGISGVDTRWEQLEWLHDMIVLSAGAVEDAVFVEVGGQRGGLWGDVLMGERDDLRRGYVSERAVPALKRGHRELWNRATEYGSDPPDSEVESVALRPVVEELWEAQREVLLDGVRGFSDPDEAVRWAHDLSKVTLGGVEEDWLRQVQSGMELKRPFSFPLYGDTPNLRMLGACRDILPWFRNAVWQQVQSASEQSMYKEADLDEFELGESLLGDDSGDG